MTLVRRELQEYRNSLVWTPVAIAASLALVMLLSVLLANRISAMGDAVLEVIMQDHAAHGLNISIHIDDDSTEITRNYRVERQENVNEKDWDFSRDWTFKPEMRDKPAGGAGAAGGGQDEATLNPVLSLLHNFMLMVLFLVSANYLLGCLYNDRRDRSILFWKSLPVSEWQEVLSKFAVVVLVVPAVFVAVSLLSQVASSLLAMLMVWRMDKDPYELVLGNIEFGSLVFNQVSGWVLTALWIAPVYAWLMLASAAARRSPFMFAIAPVIGLAIIERILLGTEFISGAVAGHLPHANEASTVGFYSYGPDWLSQDLVSIGAGLVFTALALWAAVYLRRTRFEI
jgi:hypothetical protein